MENNPAACREAFEEWTKPAALDLTGSYNNWSRRWIYVHSHVEAMWDGWKAAWSTIPAPVITDEMLLKMAIAFNGIYCRQADDEKDITPCLHAAITAALPHAVDAVVITSKTVKIACEAYERDNKETCLTLGMLAALEAALPQATYDFDFDTAYRYAAQLLKSVAPQCEPLDTIMGVLSQLDNHIAGAKIDAAAVYNRAIEDAMMRPDVWSQEESGGMVRVFNEESKKRGLTEALFAVATFILHHRRDKALKNPTAPALPDAAAIRKAALIEAANHCDWMARLKRDQSDVQKGKVSGAYHFAFITLQDAAGGIRALAEKGV